MDQYQIPASVGIGHVHLRVADLERATAFYRDVLGLTLVFYGPTIGLDAAFLTVGEYHHRVALNTFQSKDGTPPPDGHTGLHHFALVYPSREALARAVERLFQLGYPIDEGEDHGATLSVYLRDPDGNGIELYYDLPREMWFDTEGRPTMKAQPFDPRDLLPVTSAA